MGEKRATLITGPAGAGQSVQRRQTVKMATPRFTVTASAPGHRFGARCNRPEGV
jgi:hypothetical protein